MRIRTRLRFALDLQEGLEELFQKGAYWKRRWTLGKLLRLFQRIDGGSLVKPEPVHRREEMGHPRTVEDYEALLKNLDALEAETHRHHVPPYMD